MVKVVGKNLTVFFLVVVVTITRASKKLGMNCVTKFLPTFFILTARSHLQKKQQRGEWTYFSAFHTSVLIQYQDEFHVEILSGQRTSALPPNLSIFFPGKQMSTSEGISPSISLGHLRRPIPLYFVHS